jgi:hypothetical protein
MIYERHGQIASQRFIPKKDSEIMNSLSII